jgi:hypothetical protein
MGGMYPYSCSDRMCGAEDCNRCRPGNDDYVEWREGQDEADEHRADVERDERKGE